MEKHAKPDYYTGRKLPIRHRQIVRLSRLLNMQYRPSEIAEETGINVYTIYRSFIPAGCPHTRDNNNHIWIVGIEFRNWLLELHATLNNGNNWGKCDSSETAWCSNCCQCIKMLDIQTKKVSK